MSSNTKVIVVGAGPVGSLAALYAAQRGYDVEIYELRNGTCYVRRLGLLTRSRHSHEALCLLVVV